MKRFLFPILLLAVALASCEPNEPEQPDKVNPSADWALLMSLTKTPAINQQLAIDAGWTLVKRADAYGYMSFGKGEKFLPNGATDSIYTRSLEVYVTSDAAATEVSGLIQTRYSAASMDDFTKEVNSFDHAMFAAVPTGRTMWEITLITPQGEYEDSGEVFDQAAHDAVYNHMSAEGCTELSDLIFDSNEMMLITSGEYQEDNASSYSTVDCFMMRPVK